MVGLLMIKIKRKNRKVKNKNRYNKMLFKDQKILKNKTKNIKIFITCLIPLSNKINPWINNKADNHKENEKPKKLNK